MNHAGSAKPRTRVQNSVGVQFTVLANDHVVVNHDARVELAAGAHPTVSPAADARADGHTRLDHRSLIQQGRGMNTGLGTTTWVQQLQRLGESETGISQNRESQATLQGDGNQVLLIRQQHGTDRTLAKSDGQSVAFLQKAELIRAGLVESGSA